MRELQREAIQKFFPHRLGQLRYFGLTSASLLDAKAWADIIAEFVAVERGEEGREWELQHELQFEAFRSGLSGRIALLRGDIDSIIINGRDEFGNRVRFPFEVVSLDYSGGLFYRNARGEFRRLRAISELIAKQGKHRHDFVLLISCNLDSLDNGEIQRTLANMKTELIRYGVAADRVMKSYLEHERVESRLKLYVPYFINHGAAKWHFQCETQNVIFYEGNKRVRMMAFRLFLKFDPATESLRSPRERLSQIVNQPLIEVHDGEARPTSLGLPTINPPNDEGIGHE